MHVPPPRFSDPDTARDNLVKTDVIRAEDIAEVRIPWSEVKASRLKPQRFVSPEPKPNPYEAELLDILIEECAEVIQRATKMKRFGVAEVQPGQGMTNAERLSAEVGDLQALVAKCSEAGLILERTAAYYAKNKAHKLAYYMQARPEDER